MIVWSLNLLIGRVQLNSIKKNFEFVPNPTFKQIQKLNIWSDNPIQSNPFNLFKNQHSIPKSINDILELHTNIQHCKIPKVKLLDRIRKCVKLDISESNSLVFGINRLSYRIFDNNRIWIVSNRIHLIRSLNKPTPTFVHPTYSTWGSFCPGV